jgi:hypothetical protein
VIRMLWPALTQSPKARLITSRRSMPRPDRASMSSMATALALNALDDASVLFAKRFGPGSRLEDHEVLANCLSVVMRASRRETHEQSFVDRLCLYGRHDAGLVLIENLGTGDGIVQANAEIAPQVAIVLARLDAASHAHGAAYTALRRDLSLADAVDNRRESETATQRRFALGSKMIEEWCAILGVAQQADVAALLAPLYQEIIRPGPFHALIHDDLANGRQCVRREGKMHLLDSKTRAGATCCAT